MMFPILLKNHQKMIDGVGWQQCNRLTVELPQRVVKRIGVKAKQDPCLTENKLPSLQAGRMPYSW
jgi:hypothetical protein